MLTLHCTQLGHPTMLVNNAGVNNNKLILDLTDKDLNRCGLRSALSASTS